MKPTKTLADVVKEVIEAAELLKAYGLEPMQALEKAIHIGSTTLMVEDYQTAKVQPKAKR